MAEGLLNRLTKLLKKPDQPAASVDWDAFVEQSIKEDVARKRAFGIEPPKPQRTWIQRNITHPIRAAIYTFAGVIVAIVICSAAIFATVSSFTGWK